MFGGNDLAGLIGGALIRLSVVVLCIGAAFGALIAWSLS